MDAYHTKDRNLSELFYYDISEVRNKDLRKGLREYKFFLSILKSALYHFENKDFEKFDSLVGENACQIRAIKIAIIASQNQIDFISLNTRIESSIAKTEKLLEPQKLAKLMLSGITMKELLEKEEIDVIMTANEMFAFQSFLLTETKEPQPENTTTLHQNEKSAPKKLKRFDPEISANFMYCTASRARKLLAEASVRFVREVAWKSKDLNLIKMVSKEFTEEHNTWPCTPMFWTYKILLQTAQKQNIPLILHAKFVYKSGENYKTRGEETLFFKPDLGKKCNSYIQTDPSDDDLTNPACVIQGVVYLDSNKHFCREKWKKSLLKHSIHDIILAGAADHRQYPDPSISVPIDDPEFENYKAVAQKCGFSIDNPATFFINHVYSQQVGKILSFIERNLKLSANS
jgi:hypothetical protein